MRLISINPANAQEIGSVSVSTTEQVKKAVIKAKKTYLNWSKYKIYERLKYVTVFTKLVIKNQEKLAKLESLEMGKPYRQALDHLQSDINYLDYFFKNAPSILKPEIIENKNGFLRRVVRQPIGVSAVITPWNFPYTLSIWGIIPNIIVGNTVVYKPSELTPLCGQEIFSLLEKAGLPEGVVNLLQGRGKVGQELINEPIDFVWFTGSSSTGKEIYKKCGEKFIGCLLELGGSSPAVIFEDVDVGKVAGEVFAARFGNCGQICSSVKRLFVHQKIFKQFVRELAEIIKKSKVSDPFDKDTVFGPLVSRPQLQILQSQFKDACKKGASIAAAGEKPKDKRLNKGFYFPPTILTNVNFDMQVMKEEVFGPILPVMSFSTIKEAITMANKTEYGLTALVYSNNKKRVEQVGQEIDAGTVSLNTRFYQSTNCPFGGWKNSGKGVEGGKYGFWHLTRLKYICSYDKK